MDYKDIQKRLDAAHKLLDSGSPSREKFNSLRTLVSGVNPLLDRKLSEAAIALSEFEKLNQGELVELAVNKLPETTDQDKRRKKALLFFLTFWKDLKSEVIRVQQELDAEQHTSGNRTHTPGTLAKLFSFAKGPLGIVTVLAIGIVFFNLTAVEITIKNIGCESISPVSSLPFPIAGVKLPTESIAPGNEAIATLPPLTVGVDGTTPGKIKLMLFALSTEFSFSDPHVNLLFDNTPLLGKKNEFNLRNSPTHELIIECS